MAAHTLVSVKEPDMANEYCIDEFVSDNERLPTVKRKVLACRGGSGTVNVGVSNGLQTAVHNVALGLHNPGYLQKAKAW